MTTKFNRNDLERLRRAAETLDDHEYEVLAEQVWFVYESNGGQR